jgi:hypothetical protein
MPSFSPASGGVAYSSGLQLVNEVLSNLAKQFRPDGFVYDQIVSPMPVDYNIGEYPVFDPSTFFSTGGNLEVADDAETPIVDFNWSTATYHCRDRRLSTRLTRKEENQAHAALRIEYSKTVNLLSIMANNREYRLATILRAQDNGGQFTNPAITPAIKWDAGTTATPATIQGDIQNAVQLAIKACGKAPNTIVFDYEVALAIANDPTIKTQLQYRVGPEMLAAGVGILPAKLFGLNVVVAQGPMYNTARPGQSSNLAATWGQSARVLYCDPNAQWGVPATAYAFRGRVLGGDTQAPSAIMPVGSGSQEPGPAGDWAVVDRFWSVDPPAQRIRAWECVDERCVAPELGVEIQNVLSGSQYEY